MMESFSPRLQNVCRSAGLFLCGRMWKKGHGVSGSDINHRLFDLWLFCDTNTYEYLGRCVEVAFEQGGTDEQ